MWEYAKEEITRAIGAVADLGLSLFFDSFQCLLIEVSARLGRRMADCTCGMGRQRL